MGYRPFHGRVDLPDREAGALDALAAAVPGRPGQAREVAELAAARAEIERLRATVTEQAVVLHLHQGKIALGLTAGLVPPRVHGPVKQGLLDLLEHASEVGGWSLRRAAAVLGIDHVRVLRWHARAAVSGSRR